MKRIQEMTESGLHGGRVYEAARRWNVAPAEVIDFSSNINPLGPPESVLAAIKRSCEPSALRAYPDTHSFITALAEKYRLRTDEIVVGSGAASLIFAVVRALTPKRVLILEPAFAEYERACTAVNAAITVSRLSERHGFAPDFNELTRVLDNVDLVILNSPHNPSGRLYDRTDLLSFVDAAERSNTTILVDEAFIDYVPENSVVQVAATKVNLIVLRSLTKFYATPGLRVGYAVCSEDMAGKIRKQLDPWSVSTIALEAARATLTDDDFDRQTRETNSAAREEFMTALQAAGLHVLPSSANFLLALLPHGSVADLARWLEPERILIRQCESFTGLTDRHVRLAVRSKAENDRLATLISRWLSRGKNDLTAEAQRMQRTTRRNIS
jgi:threonine-phosphate decarboxylase